mmetsp:Transcript_34519/g.50686  ORF Transcript_34519/g.50686 Transcript_34519/m.50686 type:complete len:83 (+) Transcript_34519:49-297(+)
MENVVCLFCKAVEEVMVIIVVVVLDMAAEVVEAVVATPMLNGRPRQCPPDEEPVAGINGIIIRDMLCFCCNRYGHGCAFCSE